MFSRGTGHRWKIGTGPNKAFPWFMVTTNRRGCGPAALSRRGEMAYTCFSRNISFRRKPVGIGVTGAGVESYVLGKWRVPESSLVLCALKRGEAFPAAQWPWRRSENPRNSDTAIENELNTRDTLAFGHFPSTSVPRDFPKIWYSDWIS